MAAPEGFPIRLVVDANVLFGALLRDSTNRHIVLHGELELHAPDWLWDEFQRNRPFLLKKSRATEAALDLLLEGLRDRVASIPLAAVRPHLAEALARLGDEHRLDAPYVAAALAIDAGVWSHGKALAERAGIPVVTTRDILDAIGE